MENMKVKNPIGRMRTSWLFTSVVEDLSLGLVPRTNLAALTTLMNLPCMHHVKWIKITVIL